MNYNTNRGKPSTLLRLLFIVFALAMFHGSKAGDAEIIKASIRKTLNIDKEDYISVTFRNDEAFDVPEFSVYYCVYQEVIPGDWQVRYEWTQEDFTVEAQSELEIVSETMWKPLVTGRYQLAIQSYSASDIDLSNNNRNFEFIVGNFNRISFKQVNFVNPYQIENSTLGMMRIKLPPKPEELGISFINVLAGIPSETESAWIVKNLPIAPFADVHSLNYYFDLRLLNYEETEDIQDIDIAVREDTVLQFTKFDPLSWVNFNVYNLTYDVISSNEEEDIINTGLPAPEETVQHDSFPGYEYYYIGCIMPNIDLDSSAHKADTGYAGDLNACGPAAAANSMHWLEETHEDIPSTGTSHREKMEEISGLMERGNEDGVTTQQLIKGKLAYIDKYKLPIHVKYQSWFVNDVSIASPEAKYGHSAENMSDSVGTQKPPTWEFLKSEVKKGEDVEILFGWYNQAAQRNGGHWITVSGFFDSDSLKGIYFKDDGNQGDSAGIRETFIEWQNKGRWGKLVGFDGPNNHCWVESVVSESYDEGITFEDDEEPVGVTVMDNSGYNQMIIVNNPNRSFENTRIRYNLEENSTVNIEVLSLDGSILFTESQGTQQKGSYDYEIPATVMPAEGSYLIVIRAGNTSMAGQLLRIR
jgi:hypothetical protein